MLGQIEGTEVKIASRWSRFWAFFIDGLVAAAIMVVLFYFDSTRTIMIVGSASGEAFSLVFSALVYLLCNGYLLHKYGQTIGKNIFEISIVSMNNQPLSLAKIFFMRWAPFYFIMYLPTRLYELWPNYELFKFLSLLAMISVILNYLFIFGKERRCLHDRIAGTKVVDLSKPKRVDFSEA
ncbi:RDD family protein (plasmid) [Vibrio sp. THAF190c]|nr:RDD family protein [Vibrio sp. THAF190c]